MIGSQSRWTVEKLQSQPCPGALVNLLVVLKENSMKSFKIFLRSLLVLANGMM